MSAQREARRAARFYCGVCRRWLPSPPQASGGTGYGYAAENRHKKVCYDCCAKRDRLRMSATGRIALYLHDGRVTNWPGTLTFTVVWQRRSRHNTGGKRTDVWFTGPHGYVWHGYKCSDNTELLNCRRVERLPR